MSDQPMPGMSMAKTVNASMSVASPSRGRELASVIRELGRWGLPLMGTQNPNDVFETHWLTLPGRGLDARPPRGTPAR
jgi:hypothetical protein